MSASLTNEMSALKSGCGNMFHRNLKEVADGIILSSTRTGAGNEGARGNLKGNGGQDPLVSGSRDIRHILPADEKVERKL